MKITLFGLAGTGTSTTGRAVAQKLNLEFISTGDLFRAQAKDLGLTINELDALAQTEPKYDQELDERVVEYGRMHDDFIIDSRLAWHFIPNSIKVKLQADFDTRLARVARRDNMSIEEARYLTKEREEAIFDRYTRYYGIANCEADEHFDLVIDTSTASLETVVQTIVDFVGRGR